MQPNHRFIVWMANQKKKLLTKERIQILHISLAHNTCSFCEGGAVETMQHLFVNCECISEVRNELSNGQAIN